MTAPTHAPGAGSPRWQHPLGPLAAAVVVGVLLRLPGLSDGLNHDEAYTWEAFASRSYDTVTSHYPVPNNHILHTVLVRAASQVFGESDLDLRLPAFAAGVLGIPAVWWLAQAVSASALVATLAAWGLALAPVHIGYSQVARGYTLLVLLSALAGGALLRAHRSGGMDRRWWVGYGVCLFLALYTQPSAALLAAALGAWSVLVAVRSGDRSLLGATLITHGAVLATAAWAYGPILDLVLAAGRGWGVDLHAGGFVAFGGLAYDVATAVGGGGPFLLAAVVGSIAVCRSDRQLLLLAGSLGLAPFLLPLVHGIAPQPRGYLFLLPWVSVAAGLGVCAASGVWRRIAAGVVVFGVLAAIAVIAAAGHQTQPRWRDLGQRLAERMPRGEIVVAPWLMDVEVYHYAKGAIQQGVVTTLMDGRCRSLLFAANSAQERFDLAGYRLTSEVTGKPRILPMPRSAFEQVYESGPRAVYRLLSDGQPVMPDSWQWNAHPDEVTSIRFGVSGPAVTEEPGLAILNESRREFRIYSDVRFRPEADGLCVLAAARSVPGSEVSLYAADPEAGAQGERVVEHHMLLTAAKPVRAVGRDGRMWYLEALVLPVQQGQEYGVYIRGSTGERQDFADIRVFHFPWP